jgi:hypothetical protein
MSTLLSLTRRASVVLAALALAACADANDPIAGIPQGAADGLYPQILVTASRGGTAELRLSLLRKPAGVLLGSYQGELGYDPAVLTFAGASLPPGVDGVASLIEPGRVRFVGTTLDGVGEAPLLTLSFARRGEMKAGGFTVTFEDVSASTDLSDLTGTVHGGAPLITIR